MYHSEYNVSKDDSLNGCVQLFLSDQMATSPLRYYSVILCTMHYVTNNIL